MAVMERDLRQQAGVFVEQTFPTEGDTQLSAGDRRAIEKWLTDQIEQERQGWKKKVQMSLREVEKERKLALDVHGAIHKLNDKFTPLVHSLAMYREKSMYLGADDKDGKVSHVQQLERNLDAALGLLARWQDDRVTCFHILNVQQTYDDHAPLFELLQGRIGAEGIVAENVERAARENEERFEREIKLLNETLELQDVRVQQVQQKHKREIEELEQLNKELKTKLLIKSAITSSTKSCQTARRVSDACVQVSTEDKRETKSTKSVKNKGVQVKFKEREKEKEKEKEKNVSFEAALKTHRSNGEPSSRDTDPNAITSVTIVKSPYNPNAFQSTSEILQSFDILHKDFLARSKDDQVLDTSRSRKGPERPDQQTLEILRNQVIEQSTKLREGQTDYQNHLAKLRATKHRADPGSTPRGADIGPRSKDPESRATTSESMNPSDSGAKKWSQEGFLSGKTLSDKDDGNINSNGSGNGNGSRRDHHRLLTTSQCLRCNKVYKKKSNHEKACRFHPKPKEVVEKYDSAGKLLKMVCVWSCCNGKPESLGCEIGQHV